MRAKIVAVLALLSLLALLLALGGGSAALFLWYLKERAPSPVAQLPPAPRTESPAEKPTITTTPVDRPRVEHSGFDPKPAEKPPADPPSVDKTPDPKPVERVAWKGDPIDKPVLRPSDFTYVGSFKMPTSAGQRTTAFTTGGLAHRYVNGKLRFFSTSHSGAGGRVYEASYPGTGTGDAVPQAKLVRDWDDVYTGHKWLNNADASPQGQTGGGAPLSSGNSTYGLYYDPDLKRLYWNYGHWYNATNPENPSFGYSVLDDAGGKATGVGAWALRDRPEKFTRGGCTRIPKWFADRYTGGKTLGVGFGGYFSIISSGSFGPALAAAKDPDPKANPDRSALDNVPLLGYPADAPERAHRNPEYDSGFDGGKWQPKNGVGYWTWSDIIYGAGAWLDLSDKQGVLFIAKLGQGKVYYQASDRIASGGCFAWFVYDPKDLAAVARGAKKQWEIQPKYEWTDKSLYMVSMDQRGWSGDGYSQVGGVTFDPTTNRLYVLVTGIWHGGAEWYPEVFVYQVK